MKNHPMSRRAFLQTTGLAATALAVGATAARAEGVSWPIGCFNRPWVNDKLHWTYDTALDGIQAAGYKTTGLLTATETEPFIASSATPEHLASLREKIAAHGLKATMAALRTKNDLPLDEQITDMRRQIDNGKTVGVEFLLTFGVDRTAYYQNYYNLMRDAAAYAQDRGLKLVLKPHGGASGAAEEILRCLERVNHPNFKIWFDAGNIIYYTGKDPIEQLKPVVSQVTGFCAKDCDKERGNVWLEFGQGKVDFPAVFAELKRARFKGPVMVECCAQSDSAEAVTASARRNREFLERLFATL